MVNGTFRDDEKMTWYKGNNVLMTRDKNNAGIFKLSGDSKDLNKFGINRIYFNDKFEVDDTKTKNLIKSGNYFKIDKLNNNSGFIYDPLIKTLTYNNYSNVVFIDKLNNNVFLQNSTNWYQLDIFRKRTVFEFIDVTDEINKNKLHAVEGVKRAIAEADKEEKKYDKIAQEFKNKQSISQEKINTLAS